MAQQTLSPATSPRPFARARSSSSKRKLFVVSAVVVAAGIVASGLLLATRDEGSPAPVADVPRREGNAIVVGQKFLETASIRTAVVAETSLTPVIQVVGAATFDPTRTAAVGTRATGIVTKVHHVEGDTVAAGDALAEIESPQLADAQAELEVARAKQRAAELNERRERELLERSLTTAREHEQAQAALAQQRALGAAAARRVDALGGADRRGGISVLRAPSSGLVAERNVAPGQSVGPSFVAFRVGDLDRLWVELRLFERHLESTRAGDAVEIVRLSDPDEPLPGKVAHVGSVVDPATRTADVRIEVDNEKRLLRPGQAVRARIHASGPARRGLAVPKAAVTLVDGAPTVFVAESETRFVPRRIELGVEGAEYVEIRSGARAGERVVSENVFALKSELFR
jgi:cobalt-zinc-cadmium efflux system membrane fusion protein